MWSYPDLQLLAFVDGDACLRTDDRYAEWAFRFHGDGDSKRYFESYMLSMEATDKAQSGRAFKLACIPCVVDFLHVSDPFPAVEAELFFCVGCVVNLSVCKDFPDSEILHGGLHRRWY